MTEKNLDSKVFFCIPEKKLKLSKYISWLDHNVLNEWFRWNDNNARVEGYEWNIEGGLAGYIGGKYLSCKFYRYDGFGGYPLALGVSKRGILIREHPYFLEDVKKVHFVSDNFERFLSEKEISYKRTNFFTESKFLDQ